MLASAVVTGIALMSAVAFPADSESLRFTGSPLIGGNGTRVELVSIDPCPAPLPGALWTVYVMWVPPVQQGRPRFLYKQGFPVRDDGSWAATLTARGDQAGDVTVEAWCEAGAISVDYQPVTFRFTGS
jgi:hypothetical protein